MEERVILYRQNSPDGPVEVVERWNEGRRERQLLVDGALQSASYTEYGAHCDRLFRYMEEFLMAYRIHPGAERTLLIGGGGFAFPKYFIRYREGILEVAEKSAEIIGLAKRFFYLDELLETDRPLESGRLIIHNEGGETVLAERTAAFDVILNDAYSGDVPLPALKGAKGAALIRSALREGGVYAANIVTASKGPFALRVNREIRALQKVFRYTLLVPCDDTLSPWERQNCVLFASDRSL